MTGIYVRIEREGRVQSVEMEDMSDEEWVDFVAMQPAASGWHWARMLAVWIRDSVQEVYE